MGLIKLPESSINFFKQNYMEIFESGSLAEGEWNKRSSEIVKNFTNADFAIPTASNGTGMQALLQAIQELYGKNEVLIQSNTMYGVKTMVKASGFKLKGYIDCDEINLVPNVSMVEQALSSIKDKKSLVILLSHIGGLINPDIEDIAKLCKEEEVSLIEDCAHSYGASMNDKHSGLFGEGGVYSFYSTKAIFSGEGGMITTNNKELGLFLEKYVIYDRFERKLEVANNIRQSELQALFLVSLLLSAEEILSNKRQTAIKYISACEDLGIKYLKQEGSNEGNYYKFILSSLDQRIREIYKRMKMCTSKVYDYSLGQSTNIVNSHVCLPIWYGQDEALTKETLKELRDLFV